MPGTIIFKPIEANLSNNSQLDKKIPCYCMITIGDQKGKAEVSIHEGDHSKWQDSVSLVMENNQSICIVELIGNCDTSTQSKIASFELNVQELEEQGRVKKWYSLYNDKELAGEILMEAIVMTENGNEKVKVDTEANADLDRNQISTEDDIDMDEFGEYQTA